MKVTVASDSHGRDVLDKIREWNPDSLYLHCGDLEDTPDRYPDWTFVRGNNDYQGNMPNEQVITVPGHKLYMTHSHRFPYRGREEAIARRAKELGCDVALYGHTHMSHVRDVDGVLVVNPGSCWMSRDGKSPSYAVLDLEPGQKPQVQLVHEEDWPDWKPAKKSRFWDWF